MNVADDMVYRIEAQLDVEIPDQPQDGDCLRFAPLITEAAKRANLPSPSTASVIGYADAERQVIVFVHQVTRIGTQLVVDFTARQFELLHEVPARWIATTEDYCTTLASATGVPVVAFSS